MYEKAKKSRDDNTHRTDDYAEFKQIIEEKRGFILSRWCGDSACELAVKEETKATIRCIPFNMETTPGKCLHCSTESTKLVYFARAY